MAVKKQNEIAVSIPFDKIKRIQIYENPKGKSLATIMRETGADYAINGTLYNMRTRNAVCPLRIDGITKFSGPYKYWGYAWNKDNPSIPTNSGEVFLKPYNNKDIASFSTLAQPALASALAIFFI